MHRFVMPLALLSLFVSTLIHAQGPPGSPGTSPIAETQTIVDSTGLVVGEVLKIEGVGLAAASVKYVLSNGEHVVLSVNGQAINAIGQAIHPSFGLDQSRVFFKEADCSGLAYRRSDLPGPSWQLTKWQAMILDNVIAPTGPPPSSGSCPVPYMSRWLYAVDMTVGNCAVVAGPENEVTFAAYYGIDPFSPIGHENPCFAPTGGITFGGPAPTSGGTSFGTFIPYTRYEDLQSKFTAPFFIP